MFYTYVIRSIDSGIFYKGQTNNLEKRLHYHSLGQVKSTKKLIPFELVFVQICNSRSESMMIEKFLKSGTGRNFIKFIFEKSI